MPEPPLFAHRYAPAGPLGRGGSGHTLRAYDTLERRTVALKLLVQPTADGARALLTEYRRLAERRHPNLVRVWSAGWALEDGRRTPYFAAELVRGKDLVRFAEQASAAALEGAVLGLCGALAHLHDGGLVHGDVKPDNVLVTDTGRAVLVDLGAARPFGAAALREGTPGYLAPELALGAAPSPRTDLYALGVTLAELGAALSPAMRVLAAQCSERDPAARPPDVASALVRAGLSPERLARGGDAPFVGRASELARVEQALAAVREGPGPRVVWIEAKGGAGGTRFVDEACERASEHWDVLPIDLRHGGLAAALARAARQPAPSSAEGVLALLAELAGTARRVCVRDADLAPRAEAELLSLALGAVGERDACTWLVQSRAAPPAQLVGRVVHVTLGPLAPRDVARWAGDRVPGSRVAALHAHTGGLPGALARCFAALDAGRLSVEALGRAGTADPAGLGTALADASQHEQRVLVRVALGELIAAAELPPGLVERGLVVLRESGAELASPGERAALLGALDPARVHAEAARLRAQLPPEAPTIRRAELALWAGDVADLEALLVATAPDVPDARALRDAAAPLAQGLGVAGLTALAALSRSVGEPALARPWLARALAATRRDPPAALRLELAENALALGALPRAERLLRRAPSASPELAECLARVLVRRGDARAALELAELALPSAAPALAARLYELLALAHDRLGDSAEALTCLEQAAACAPSLQGRAAARRAALEGYCALRAGQHTRAIAAYERTLALAEAPGLADLVVNALLNLAAARQALGQLGAAGEAYRRAQRMARALGRRSSEHTARVNLGNLALECGDLEQARAVLAALAEEPLAPAIAAARLRYALELEVLSGRADAVRSALSARLARDLDDPGERDELCVLCAEAELVLGLGALARERLAALRENALPSLRVRALLVRAAAEREEGRASEARALLDEAHACAEREGLVALLPRVELARAQLYEATDAPSLAEEQRRRARVRWERMALELPAGLRARFWEHPLRRDLRREPALEQGDAASLSRVIELSRRINAQRTIDDVLAFALDAALELTSAERGFVLLQRAGEPGCSVRAARRVDEAALERGPRGFSRSIAERVVSEGEPVVTLDAARDPRFRAQASVHALGLSAVLCVPILGAKGLRGALYLDHRYAQARFGEQHATLATALAEQVAVALANTQLVAELAEKQRELVRKQRRVEELLADREREVASLSAALARVTRERGARTRYPEIVGDGEAMRRLFAVLDRIVDASFPVLVLGESGTGKELVARALHSHGPRAAGPFVALNCGALPETLLESELFGHVRGAFTGAERDKPGLFVSAHGGTLFLDEVGELSLSLQVKLLRVLSEGRVRPLGGTRELPVDVRVVAATHRNLRARVAEGSFREDLFYRLSVIELVVPPLRERSEDVLPIAEALLARSARPGEAPKRLAPDAARALLRHRFPGNVRELENALLRASALAEGAEIHAADLALDAPAPGSAQGAAAPRTRAEHEERAGEAILSALRKEEWNVTRAARLLGMPRNTLYRKLARMGVVAPERPKGRPRAAALKER